MMPDKPLVIGRYWCDKRQQFIHRAWFTEEDKEEFETDTGIQVKLMPSAKRRSA